MSKASRDSRSYWVVAPGRGEIRTEICREPTDQEVLVRTLYSAISRGTETLVWNGAVPPSEFLRMRAPFQDGDFPAPVKYGYINVGQVEQGPSELIGRVVFCLYPHQTRYVVPADAVYPVPADVPAARAVLAAHLESAVNCLWDAVPRIGDRIAIVGAGTLGCMIAWLLGRIPGCGVELIDVDPGKAPVADALGVGFRSPEDATPEADLVIHTSATEAGLSTALRLAGFEAKVIELSWYGNRQPKVALGEAFHSRRLGLVASQVGSIPPAQRGRWTLKRRMELVLRLLGDSDLEVLITGQSNFDELPTVMQTLATKPGPTLCHRIAYQEESHV